MVNLEMLILLKKERIKNYKSMEEKYIHWDLQNNNIRKLMKLICE